MKKIFITGATGCIGHYVLDELLDRPDIELHLLVRDPGKFRFDYRAYSNIVLHRGGLDEIAAFQDVLSQMQYVIHIATNWDNSPTAFRINVERTHELFNCLSPEVCERVVYFSTASILGPGNTPVQAAEQYGTGYVASKYKAYQTLDTVTVSDRITTLFPTLVFGGDDLHPYSHITEGIKTNTAYLKWIRFLYLDSAFHFMHGSDIAKVTVSALLGNAYYPFLVLGQKVISGKDAIFEICTHFNVSVPFQLKVPSRFILWLALKLKIQIAPWDEYCIRNPFFHYEVVNPEVFELQSNFPTLKSLLNQISALQ